MKGKKNKYFEIKSVARNDELHKAEWKQRGCRHRVVTVRNAGA